MVPKFDDRCPYVERNLKTKRYREEGRVSTEAEAGVMLTQTKKWQGLPATTGSQKGQKRFFPRAFSGNVTLLTP